LKVCIDAGHGGRDRSNVGPTGYVEADGALSMALACRRLLTLAGLDVIMTRADDRDLCPDATYSQAKDLCARADFANAQNADLFISVHTNAADNANAKGTEAFCYRWNTEAHKLAIALEEAVVEKLGTVSRGAKERNFAVLRETDMPAALVEVAFHSNPAEEALLKDESFLRKAGEAIGVGILVFLGIPTPSTTVVDAPTNDSSEPTVDHKTPILAKVRTTQQRAWSWFKKRQWKHPCAYDDETMWRILTAYWTIAPEEEVEPLGAFAQACKETGGFSFTRENGTPGDVRPSQWNFCGLGATGGIPGLSFASIEAGVRAHCRHLRLYATEKEKARTLNDKEADPRGLPESKMGVAPCFEDLGGHWAPSLDYGVSIVRDYMQPMMDYEPVTSCGHCQEYVAEVKALKEKLAQIREIVG
jgi:N-acetylmuramoyl-L-alanine amidase